ncbi:LOW QUALITY PROTEIN: hypothetical protein J0S82_006783 [Galemys pyrenaicus]|uniref:Secreted protein n=1 Tax=Galemys pyrenaicus TaxID=202257 RepID=A0A8J6AUS2_GALPY|nr:LOW QUALITY PROTEIN: hypothetical protein J0S82_006783 [Galemys pyrenaicus]
MFVLGIIIILMTPSRVQNSARRPPPPRVPLLGEPTPHACVLRVSLSPTGKKVKCRKADSRSERSGSTGGRGEWGGARRRAGVRPPQKGLPAGHASP